jgi:ATP-dependent Clp protease ATP-binding subunit ClpB
LQINLLNKRLKDQDIKIEVTNEALQLLAEKGFDPQYGARPVKRVVQNMVLNELAKRLLTAEIQKEKTILLDAFDQELVFRNA